MRLVVESAMLDWFRARYGEETEIQRLLWQRLGDSPEHILAISPTGSGKTMAMFFPVLLELLSPHPACEGIAVLYISPLKALNNDMQRNLLAPLEGLRAHFHEKGLPAAPVRIAVRSGDSTARERKQIETDPPQILATTPESLQILLLSRHAKRLLSNIRLVIIDEIHVLAGTKRGAHLFALLELLEEYACRPRRAALSATVRDPEKVARLLGGSEAGCEDARGNTEVASFARSEAGAPRSARCDTLRRGAARRVTIVRAEASLPRQIRLAWPLAQAEALPRQGARDTLMRMAPAFRRIIEENRSTLFFTNSRRLAERMASLINHEFDAPLASAHHGSLSRELRLAVENALKKGSLRAVVATASLELGIDIGQLDAVVLIGSPTGIARTVQRTGRAAHHPGGVGRVLLFPTSARDALDALALSRAVMRQDLEELRTSSAPLDVLAQFVLTAAAEQERSSDWLYARACAAAPFAALTREHFESVLNMLAGRAGGRRHASLPARARYEDGIFAALPGTLFLLRTAGGTIPPRSGLAMRDAASKAVLGEVDEEFAWERRIGDVFRFANRAWRLAGMDDQGILVTQLAHTEGMMPFWRAEAADSSDELVQEVCLLLDSADADYEGEFLARVRESAAPGDEDALVSEVGRYIEGHRREDRLALPNSARIVCEEIVNDSMPGRAICLLTARGGRINRALMYGFAAWGEREDLAALHIHHDNDAILISGIPDAVCVGQGRDCKALLLDFFRDFDAALVMQGLYASRHFGMHFRDVAARALVLPRDMPGRYRPFWKFRERARRLLAELSGETTLPLFHETSEECLAEVLDIEGAASLARDVLEGRVELFTYTHDIPSPMAGGVLWARANELLYADDTPTRPPRAVGLPEGQLGKEALAALKQRRDGVDDGLLLTTADDLLDWLRVRILVPEELWMRARALAGLAIPDASVCVLPAADKSKSGFVLSRADLPVLASIRNGDEDAPGHLYQWLCYRGPETQASIAEAFQADAGVISLLIDALLEDERARLLPDGRILTEDNLDFVLRQVRNARRLEVQSTRPLSDLPRYTAALQGVYDSLSGIDGLALALEKLFACFLPPALWESEVLPLRLAGYAPVLLDELFAEGDLVWAGDKEKRIAIFPKNELHTFFPFQKSSPDASGGEALLPSHAGRLGMHAYAFEELLRFHGAASPAMTARLWAGVWEGRVSNTTWEAVRAGIESGFPVCSDGAGRRQWTSLGAARRPSARPMASATDFHSTQRLWASLPALSKNIPVFNAPPGRTGFMRWRQMRPDDGYWFSLEDAAAGDSPAHEDADALAANASCRARLELLLLRWGIVSREIAQASGCLPSWQQAYRALVRMEMEGEVVAGRYFDGLAGVQFVPGKNLSLFAHLESRRASPFIASIHDPIFPPVPALFKEIRRAGRPGIFVTGYGLAAALYAGGRRVLLLDPAGEGKDGREQTINEIADMLFERQRARARTLTIKKIEGPGNEKLITALLERGARRCADGIEVGWRADV